jgi:hypothetical protein
MKRQPQSQASDHPTLIVYFHGLMLATGMWLAVSAVTVLF